MKLLIITNLFPNALEPNRGLFNKQQFLALAKHCELRVVAPVPWFPRSHWLRRFSAWHAISRVPERETIDGIEVYHPRYLVMPRMARWLHSLTFARGVRGAVEAVHREFPFDRILATWAYPDVVAATGIAKRYGVPIVAKVHGSDLNVLTRGPVRRRVVAAALRRCATVIAVSEGLKARAVELGIPEDRVAVIPNAVDRQRFQPQDRTAARRRLGLPVDGKLVLFLGNLVPVRGVDVLVDGFRQCLDRVNGQKPMLVMVGEGALRKRLEQRVVALRLQPHVRVLGARDHEEVPLWLSACDLLCLPSRNEGCPNVVLEALACGRPVVGTAVGAMPHLLRDPACGILVPSGDVKALAEALQQGLTRSWNPEQIRNAVVADGWSANAGRLAGILNAACNGVPHHSHG